MNCFGPETDYCYCNITYDDDTAIVFFNQNYLGTPCYSLDSSLLITHPIIGSL